MPAGHASWHGAIGDAGPSVTIDCHTCHIPNTISNLHQLYLYTTQRPDAVVKHAEIDRSICEKCHTGGGNASKFNQVLETPGHKVHVGKQRVECVQCHAT